MLRAFSQPVALTICLIFSLAQAASAVTIAQDGQARCAIVVAEDATAVEQRAAAELCDFLSQVTGAEFAPSNHAPNEGHRIFVGPDAARTIDANFTTDGLGDEGFVICTVGDDLILAGGHPRGTIYAAYAFLEDHVGCHWWSPTASTIPSKPTLSFAAIDVRFIPQLEYRVSYWASSFDPDWAVRNRVHGTLYPLSDDRGGSFTHMIFCHSYDHLIAPAEYFDKHPEWFSLNKGERRADGQLCLTNDAMLAEMINNVRKRLRADPRIRYAWVSQNDRGGMCECDNCAAVDAEEDSPAGLVLRVANAVAEALEEEFPDVIFATLAYQYTQAPPKVTRPRDNVMVCLCSIPVNNTQPIDHGSNGHFLRDLQGWAAITDRLYLWEYTMNFWHPMYPQPNIRTLGPNIKIYTDHGMKGMFAQGSGEGNMVEYAELRAWLIAQMLWDPTRDPDALITEFLRGYYGPAGAEIEKSIDAMLDEARRVDFYSAYKYHPNGGHTYGPPALADARIVTLPAIIKSWQHLQAAAQAVKDDAELSPRVRIAQLPMLYLLLMRWAELRATATKENLDWPFPPTAADAAERYIADLTELMLTDEQVAEQAKYFEYIRATAQRADAK